MNDIGFETKGGGEEYVFGPIRLTTIASRVLLIVALVVCGCGAPSSKSSKDQNRGAKPGVSTAANPPTPPNDVRLTGTYAGEWSVPVHGLSARLLVTLQDSGTHTSRWAQPVILEVRNTSSTPLSFIDQPTFTDSAVRDSDGNALPQTSNQDGNHKTGMPQWAVIPGNTYLGIRVDTTIPMDYGLHFGLITPEAQKLTATLVAKHREGPENQWNGEIQVPSVLLTSKRTGP